jgi:acetyltransferase-like isoleucine patch superfamily enzyme
MDIATNIHDTAIIHKNVKIGKNSIIEPFAILGIKDRFHPTEQVLIGDNAFIGSRCTVYDNVTAGNHFDISDQTTIFYNNRFGDYCRIGPKAVIKNGCVLGNNVRVNANVFLEEVIIGSNVFIGPGVIFTDDFHPPCPKRCECVPKTVVEDHVSIGANASIAPGITIGHHTQIYLGAVITKNVEPYSVMAGSPARKVKDFRELKCNANLFTKAFAWWEENLVENT